MEKTSQFAIFKIRKKEMWTDLYCEGDISTGRDGSEKGRRDRKELVQSLEFKKGKCSDKPFKRGRKYAPLRLCKQRGAKKGTRKVLFTESLSWGGKKEKEGREGIETRYVVQRYLYGGKKFGTGRSFTRAQKMLRKSITVLGE